MSPAGAHVHLSRHRVAQPEVLHDETQQQEDDDCGRRSALQRQGRRLTIPAGQAPFAGDDVVFSLRDAPGPLDDGHSHVHREVTGRLQSILPNPQIAQRPPVVGHGTAAWLTSRWRNSVSQIRRGRGQWSSLAAMYPASQNQRQVAHSLSMPGKPRKGIASRPFLPGYPQLCSRSLWRQKLTIFLNLYPGSKLLC